MSTLVNANIPLGKMAEDAMYFFPIANANVAVTAALAAVHGSDDAPELHARRLAKPKHINVAPMLPPATKLANDRFATNPRTPSVATTAPNGSVTQKSCLGTHAFISCAQRPCASTHADLNETLVLDAFVRVEREEHATGARTRRDGCGSLNDCSYDTFATNWRWDERRRSDALARCALEKFVCRKPPKACGCIQRTKR